MEVFDYFCDHVSWYVWLFAFVAFCVVLLRKKSGPVDPRDADMRADDI